jgi:hypothetical protein
MVSCSLVVGDGSTDHLTQLAIINKSDDIPFWNHQLEQDSHTSANRRWKPPSASEVKRIRAFPLIPMLA